MSFSLYFRLLIYSLVNYFVFLFFFFNDTATTEIYTLSLHDALPISRGSRSTGTPRSWPVPTGSARSEEHTSELQSRFDLVCRLLLEKKKNNDTLHHRDSTPTYHPIRAHRVPCLGL